MDKKLLRKIKQEGFSELDYDNEILDNALVADYIKTHTIPISEWSNNEIFTRMCELIHVGHKLYELFPQYYNEYNYEYYDLMDEIDNRYDSYYHYNHMNDYL